MDPELTLLVCPYLRREVEGALAAEGLAGAVAVAGLELECDHPPADPAPLLARAGEVAPPVLILAGECLGRHREALAAAGIALEPEGLCFELLLNPTLLGAHLAAGDHLLTPAMLEGWREKVAQWGFTPGEAREFYREGGGRLLLLDSGVLPGAASQLRRFADHVGLGAATLPVGLEMARRTLASLVWAHRARERERQLAEKERQLTDAALVVELTGRLTGHWSEEEVIGTLLELFAMLYAPRESWFVPLGSGELPPLLAWPHTPEEGELLQGIRERLSGVTAGAPVGEEGFVLPIDHGGELLGVVEVVGVAFPRYRDLYLNQALQIAPVAGLALANARSLRARERDGREIRRLNRSLEQRLAELHALNEELEAFTYSVSHDLRSPLRAIDGFSALLAEELGEGLSGQQRHYLERLRAGAVRMGQLIDDLLRLSRASRGELERHPCDLTAMVRSVLAGLAEKEPQRQVTVRVAPDLTAEADPRYLLVVLENLLGNAWKYTRHTPGATITVSGREGVFTVADNGAGFDMDHAQRLFQPFQRLHSHAEFEGSGIGLSTVKRIIQRHGGEIRATAAPGEGAAFHFTLQPGKRGGDPVIGKDE